MGTLKNSWKLIILFLLLAGYFQVSAQVSSVNNYLSKVNDEVSQINQFAGNKQVYEAIARLNETRRDLDRYVNYYLEDEMRKAKAENSAFAPTLSVSFSSVLTAAYWEDRVRQAQKSIDLAESAYSERNYQRTLDSQDKVWSYLVAVYGVGKTLKDVMGNVETAEFYDAFKSAKEGVDDFIENYKKIEEARLQIINTELYETNVRGLIQKGKIMEEKCWQFSSFMRTYEQDVNDFYQVVNRLNQKINEISNKTEIDLSSAEYSWSGQKYLTQINTAANQFKSGNGNYESIKSQIEAINEQAENEKIQIFQNIQNSGANDAFERGNQLEDQFNEFYDLSIDVLDECYRFDQNRGEETSKNTNVGTDSNSSQNLNIPTTDVVVNPPGTRKPNSLYHGRWVGEQLGREEYHFDQNGSNVEIYSIGTGQIDNGVLICKRPPNGDEYDFGRDYEFKLLGDGFTMEVKYLSFGNKYETKKLKYWGMPKLQGADAEVVDNDMDGVPNNLDKCPNTTRGLTVDNGGVDIAGCSTGQNTTGNTSNSDVAGNNYQQPSITGSSSVETSNANNANSATKNVAATTNAFAGAKTSNTANQYVTTSEPANTSKNSQSVKAEPVKIDKSWATKDLRQGFSSTAIIPISELKKYDKLVFKHVRGQFVYLDVYWNGINHDNEIYHETKQTIFSTADLLSKIPNNAYQINVIVNRYKNIECTMQGWTLPAGVAIPSDWSIVGENGNLNGGSSGSNTANGFDELIRKADEAFNKKYWNESEGARSSSNPKQESLDFLRKAEPLINQEQDINQRYSMVLTLASKYAEFAKRVFVNSAKNEFIQQAGSLLSKYGSSASSLTNQKATAYNEIADGWRELTKAAMWGGHQYNKAACDIEAKKYYDLALREDRSNVQLQKTVEKINAPKKPVPAAVAATKPIPESSWAKAENLRNMIVENIPIQLDDGPHYSEIGLMKIDMGSINVGSGKVWLLKSGAKDWELVTKSGEYIFVGDKIKTSDDATNISFDYSVDKTHLVIKSGSVVTFYLDQIYIERGNTEMYVQKRGKEFLVITPKAVTGCRGTEFSVKVDNSGTTEVHLFEGIVEMRNSTEISYLTPGETAKVSNDDEAIESKTFNINQYRLQHQVPQNSNTNGAAINTDPFKFVTGGGKIIRGN